MPRKSTSPLAAKLDQLNITVEEVAAVCRVPVEVVTGFIENGPDDEGSIRLRWLDDDDDAQRRVNHHRRSYQGDLRGAGMAYAGIEGVPYGTADAGKVSGGAPS